MPAPAVIQDQILTLILVIFNGKFWAWFNYAEFERKVMLDIFFLHHSCNDLYLVCQLWIEIYCFISLYITAFIFNIHEYIYCLHIQAYFGIYNCLVLNSIVANMYAIALSCQSFSYHCIICKANFQKSNLRNFQQQEFVSW